MVVTSKVDLFATLINSLDSWEPFSIVKKSSNLDVTGLEIMFLDQKYVVFISSIMFEEMTFYYRT